MSTDKIEGIISTISRTSDEYYIKAKDESYVLKFYCEGYSDGLRYCLGLLWSLLSADEATSSDTTE